MNHLEILYEGKKFSQIIKYAFKYLDYEGEMAKDDAFVIIKTLFRYEYEEAAFIFFEKYKRIKGFATTTISAHISEIARKFSKINHTPIHTPNKLRTTSEIYLSNLSAQRIKKYRIESSARILLVIDSLGPGGAERQFVTLLNHLSTKPPDEVQAVYGLVLTNNKVNSDFYLKQTLPSARPNLIFPLQDEIDQNTTNILDSIEFGSKGKKISIKKIRTAIKEYKIDVAIGFLEETSINTCIAALYENIIGITRFGSLPNIIGREVEDDLYIKYKIRLNLLSAIDSPNVIWGANSQKCLNKYLIHSKYNNKLHAKNVLIMPNIVNIIESKDYIDAEFEKLIGKILIISIMRLSQEKRPDFFAQIATSYKDNPNVYFVLIGDGPMSHLIEKAQQEGASIYWIKNTDKISYYLTKSSIYLMTSIVEGSPNAVIESSYFGIPSVIADIGGVSETYTHGLNSMFVENPLDIECYINTLRILIKSTEMRRTLGENAFQKVKSRHGGLSTSVSLSLILNKYMR